MFKSFRNKLYIEGLKEKVLLLDICLDPHQLLTYRLIITLTTGWHCVSFFSSDQLSPFFFSYITSGFGEELRFQLVCTI